MKKSATWLGIAGLVLVLYGGIAQIELESKRQMSQEFLSVGTRATADQVELDAAPGKGDPVLDTVTVGFKTADGRTVHTELAAINSYDNAEVAREGRQAPAAGSRYAPPLGILYMPQNASEALAVVDAEHWAHNSKYRRLAWAPIGTGLAALIAAAVILRRRTTRDAS